MLSTTQTGLVNFKRIPGALRATLLLLAAAFDNVFLIGHHARLPFHISSYACSNNWNKPPSSDVKVNWK